MIAVPAMITKVETMADRSLKVIVRTQELTKEQKSEVVDLDHQYGAFCFAQEGDKLEIPAELPEFKDDRSPSQRMRGVLYRIWDQNTDKSVQFDLYYRGKMDEIITKLKEQLD